MSSAKLAEKRPGLSTGDIKRAFREIEDADTDILKERSALAANQKRVNVKIWPTNSVSACQVTVRYTR